MYFTLFVVLSVVGSGVTDQANDDFARNYLKRYGYLAENTYDDKDAMTSAILNMQKEFGLILTGALDSETLTVMRKPRCGISDFRLSDAYQTNKPKAKLKWPSPHFHYHIENQTQDLGKERTVELIKQAQREREKVTPITYAGVADKKSWYFA